MGAARGSATDTDGRTPTEGEDEMTTTDARTMDVNHLVENDRQLCAAIEVELVSRYGHEDDRMWLWEGRYANVITFDRGNGHCAGFHCELKHGTTAQELEARLTAALHDPEFEARSLLERYHAEYPTDMVDLKARRFPPDAVLQSAGMKRMRHGENDQELLVEGEYADLTCLEPGRYGQGLRVQDVQGTNGHDPEEFWARLTNCLNS